MSAISASGTGLFQFFQSVSPSSASQASPQVASSTPADGQQGETAPVQGEHHRHHHCGHGQLFGKIEQAVTSALQTAQSDPSADPNAVVQNAISQVLNGDQSDGSSTTASDGSSTSATGATSTDPNGSATPQAFFQLLQSVGVDPQQFHQDFLNAIQQAQNGNADPSAALKSFPPGSTVDTLG